LTRYVPQLRQRRGLPADDDEDEELADDLDDLGVDGEDEAPGRSKAKYMKVLRNVANRQTTEVVVDLADLRKVNSLP